MDWDWLRDSAWGGIGAIATVLSLILSVVIELRRRFSRTPASRIPRSPELVTNSAGSLRPVQLGRPRWTATLVEDLQMFATVGSFVGWLLCAILLAQTFFGRGFFSLGQTIITLALGLAAIAPVFILLIWISASLFEKDNLPLLDLLGVGGLYIVFIAVALFWSVLLGAMVPPVRETIESNVQHFVGS